MKNIDVWDFTKVMAPGEIKVGDVTDNPDGEKWTILSIDLVKFNGEGKIQVEGKVEKTII